MSAAYKFLVRRGGPICLAVAIAFWAGSSVQAAEPSAFTQLKSDLSSGRILKLQVYSIPYAFSPRAPLRPDDVRLKATRSCAVVLSPSERQGLIAVLSNSVVKSEDWGLNFPAYWVVSFLGENGQIEHEIALDAEAIPRTVPMVAAIDTDGMSMDYKLVDWLKNSRPSWPCTKRQLDNVEDP